MLAMYRLNRHETGPRRQRAEMAIGFEGLAVRLLHSAGVEAPPNSQPPAETPQPAAFNPRKTRH